MIIFMRNHLRCLPLLVLGAILIGTWAPVSAQQDAILPVSVSTDGALADAGAANPSLSADGRLVVFDSTAANLQPGDANGLADVFLHDRQTGETRILSASPAGVQGDGPSTRPVISGNGRMIVFESAASNLAEGDANGVHDIFVYDRLTGLIRLVSAGRNGSAGAGASSGPDIDFTGRYLVFESAADDLVLGDDGGVDAFVYDLVTGNVLRIPGGRSPVISGDGRAVVYTDPGGALQLYHRVLGTTVEIAAAGVFPGVSHTGRNVAYVRDASVRVLDRETGGDRTLSGQVSPAGLRLSSDATTALYSVEGAGLVLLREGAEGIPVWESPVGPVFDLSADGGVVVFSAAGLEPGHPHGQIYVREMTPQAESYHLAGRVTDARGLPLGLATISDGRGGNTRTDLDGYFYLSGYPAGPLTLTPEKEGFEFDPVAWNLSVIRDVAGYLFSASSEEKLLEEARLDIGMPYDFNRGCERPDEGCGKPFHGFAAGFCTDLVLDAYTFGLDYDIDFALEQDAYAHPEHFYRWRDARDAHDMWRYFHFSGQMLAPDAGYLPGDIVFFDWSGDGEIDHVALVSEVETGRPVTLIDATGVTEQNPSGLAAELDWQGFHTTTFRGHARWNGTYEPVYSGFPAETRVLQSALSGGGIFMRLVDSAGRAASFGEAGLPGAAYFDLEWEEVISQLDPAGRYTVEIRSVTGSPQPFIFAVQTLSGGLITGRQVFSGVAAPDEVVRIDFTVLADPAGELGLRSEGGGRTERPSGLLRKDR
jgi:Tol biopolymer transport system component